MTPMRRGDGGMSGEEMGVELDLANWGGFVRGERKDGI